MDETGDAVAALSGRGIAVLDGVLTKVTSREEKIVRAIGIAVVMLGLVACSSSESKVCAADRPCFGYPFVCSGIDRYFQAADHDCHFTCGPGACMGGTCDPMGSELMCPTGTRCIALQWQGHQGTPPCASDVSDAGSDL